MEFCLAKYPGNPDLTLWATVDYDLGLSKPHHAFQQSAVGGFSHTPSEVCVDI